MDLSDETDQARAEAPGADDRKGPSRTRGEASIGPGGPHGRSSHDTRRRRGKEQRYVGWGDGLERAFCTRAAQLLPETFPVASHPGAATIPAVIVGRRPDSLLLCIFSHHGPHVWPDGELVAESSASTDAPGGTP